MIEFKSKQAANASNKSLAALYASTLKGLWSTVNPVAGKGNYQTIEAAVAAGEPCIFIRSGTYVITQDITLTNQILIGENKSSVIVKTKKAINIDSGNTRHNIGTVTVTNGSNQLIGAGTVFTNFTGSNPRILIDNGAIDVISIDNATTITLRTNWEGPTRIGVSYFLFDADTRFSMISNLTIAHAPDASNATTITMSGIYPMLRNCTFQGEAGTGSLAFFVRAAAGSRICFGARIIDCEFRRGRAIQTGTLIPLELSGAASLTIRRCFFDPSGTDATITSDGRELNISNVFAGELFDQLNGSANVQHSHFTTGSPGTESPVSLNFTDSIFVQTNEAAFTGMFYFNFQNLIFRFAGDNSPSFNGPAFAVSGASGAEKGTVSGIIVADAEENGIDLEGRDVSVKAIIVDNTVGPGIRALVATRNAITAIIVRNSDTHGILFDSFDPGVENIINAGIVTDNTGDGIRLENNADKNIVTSIIALGNGGTQINNTLGGVGNVVVDNIVV